MQVMLGFQEKGSFVFRISHVHTHACVSAAAVLTNDVVTRLARITPPAPRKIHRSPPAAKRPLQVSIWTAGETFTHFDIDLSEQLKLKAITVIREVLLNE
jgi:hypothetical protein